MPSPIAGRGFFADWALREKGVRINLVGYIFLFQVRQFTLEQKRQTEIRLRYGLIQEAKGFRLLSAAAVGKLIYG